MISIRPVPTPAYNGLVAESIRVPEDQFKTVVKALLNTPPLPLADIPRKRKRETAALKKKRP